MKKRKFKLSLKKFKVADLNTLNSVHGGSDKDCGGGGPGTDTGSRNDDCDNNPMGNQTYTCKDCPPVFTFTFFC